MKIPTIDFRGESVKPGTASWATATQNVRAALEEFGCFVAIHDLFTSDTSSDISTALRDLFDLPVEVKKRNVSDNPFYGYRGARPSMPLYESAGVFDAVKDVSAIQNFTDLMWPSGNQDFCEIVYAFAKKLSELDQIVSNMVYQSYGLEKHHDSYVESLAYLIRAIVYQVPESNGGPNFNVGCDAHTDKSSISIIHQNEVNGLRVKTRDGKWISVDNVPPSSLVIVAGDSLSAWSNGRIHAPLHQVVMKDNETLNRYSFALFSYSQGIIGVPEELVDDEHPLLYKPFHANGLLEFLMTEEGRKADDFLKAYCGV